MEDNFVQEILDRVRRGKADATIFAKEGNALSFQTGCGNYQVIDFGICLEDYDRNITKTFTPLSDLNELVLLFDYKGKADVKKLRCYIECDDLRFSSTEKMGIYGYFVFALKGEGNDTASTVCISSVPGENSSESSCISFPIKGNSASAVTVMNAFRMMSRRGGDSYAS